MLLHSQDNTSYFNRIMRKATERLIENRFLTIAYSADRAIQLRGPRDLIANTELF